MYKARIHESSLLASRPRLLLLCDSDDREKLESVVGNDVAAEKEATGTVN